MPIKCAGAPQKIMYLMADHHRRQGKLNQAKIEFCLAGDVMFGVPFFVPPLLDAVKDYGINVRYKHHLKAVDAAAKRAIFMVTDEAGATSEIEKSFDLMHVTPPQTGLDFVRASPLANAAGWIEVDQGTLQHTRYQNIFGLGDAASTPNAKTAAAVRMQVPVVVKNLLSVMKGQRPRRCTTAMAPVRLPLRSARSCWLNSPMAARLRRASRSTRAFLDEACGISKPNFYRGYTGITCSAAASSIFRIRSGVSRRRRDNVA